LRFAFILARDLYFLEVFRTNQNFFVGYGQRKYLIFGEFARKQFLRVAPS